MNKLSKESARRQMQSEMAALIDEWIKEKNLDDTDLWEDAEIGFLHDEAGNNMAMAALTVLFALSDAQTSLARETFRRRAGDSNLVIAASAQAGRRGK